SNIESILREGLIPVIGPRARDCGEVDKAVYFFLTVEATEDAVSNWLGEYFEETDIVVLECELPSSVVMQSSASYEVAVIQTLPPSCIKRITDGNREVIKFEQDNRSN
ncbi:MAG: hypothetical protein ACLP29_06230, partial [Dissulfurispiraceae bacterium]